MSKIVNHTAGREGADLRDRFLDVFRTVQDPIDGCGLEVLYDPGCLRHISSGGAMAPGTPHGWTTADRDVPWLVALDHPDHDAFDVMSFRINEVSASGVKISVYDIFVASPMGMAYTLESRGHVRMLELDFESRTISGDIDGLFRDGQAAGTPIGRVVRHLWAMMTVPPQIIADAA